MPPTQKRKRQDMPSMLYKRPRIAENSDPNNGYLQHICDLQTYIVGIRFYGGQYDVSVGSKIWLERDHHNPIDKNAIKCNTVDGEVIGFICKELAVSLARFLDGIEQIDIRGTIDYDAEDVSGRDLVLPVRLHLSARVSQQEELIRKLEQYQYYNSQTHNKTAPMKKRDVNGEKMFMAYHIVHVPVRSLEKDKNQLDELELRHILVMFALLLEENNEIRLEDEEWMKKLNCLNTTFKLEAKSEDILRKRLNSKSLRHYIVMNGQIIAFKSNEELNLFVAFVSKRQEYIDYFIQHATKQGLYRYCRTSRQVSAVHDQPVLFMNAGQINKLIHRLEFGILMHPIVEDESIHSLVSKNLQIPRQILSWNENGRKFFLYNIQNGKEKIFHSRWTILGCAQVGKTTLLKKIRGLPLEEVLHTKPTVGVELHSRIFYVEADILKDVTTNNVSPIGITLVQKHSEQSSEPARIRGPVEQEHKTSSAQNPNPCTTNVNVSVLKDVKNQEVFYERKSSKEKNTKTNKKNKSIRGSPSFEETTDEFGNFIQHLSNKMHDKKRKTIDILDFAGESDYYASHQLFLRPQGGYILVLNMSEDLDECSQKTSSNSMMYKKWTNGDFINYWLSSIQTFSPSAPVILVATHAEGKTPRDIEKYFVDVWSTPKVQKLKYLLDEDRKFTVTLKSNRNVKELKAAIVQQSKKLGRWGCVIPRKWALCEKWLNGLQQKQKVISLSELKYLLDTNFPTFQMKDKELLWMLKFFHEIGDIIHFNEQDLKDFVILDVNFLLKIFKCLINTDVESRGKIARRFGKSWENYQENGFLEDHMCSVMLTEITDFQAEEKDILFQYMNRIGILVSIPDAGNEKLWYVPSMNTTQLQVEDFDNYHKSSVLCYDTTFLPDIIYHRLVSEAVTTGYFGEIASDRDRRCMYQNVCIFQNATHFILLGRCRTSIQIQIACQEKSTDVSISTNARKNLSKLIKELESSFQTHMTFTEGLLCCERRFLDAFLHFGMAIEEVQEMGEKSLCKKCPLKKKHTINPHSLLSFWMEEDVQGCKKITNEKRDLCLKFDYVSEKLTKEHEVRELSMILNGDRLVGFDEELKRSKRMFKCLINWFCRCPDAQHLVELTEGLSKIERSDVADELNDIHHAKYIVKNIPFPSHKLRKQELEMVAVRTSAAYFRVGIFLGILPHALDEIENDTDRVRDRMISVLKKGDFTRQDMCEALNFIERNDIIKDLIDMWNHRP